MKKEINDTDWLDFETGQIVKDNIAIWRNYQSLLYKIGNPYVGNKRKILVNIANEIEKSNIGYDSVTDAFSGSGVVSYFFKLCGKEVNSNDLLTSSYYNLLTFLENSKKLINNEELEFLCNNQNANKGSFIQTEYKDRFSLTEAVFLDNYRANVDVISGDSLHKKAYAIVLIEHYIMQNCFLGGRLNHGQILAQLQHRVDHAKNKGSEMDFKLSSLTQINGDNKYTAFNLDAIEFLNKTPTTDILYLDPPYGGQQSNYAQMFALCEEYIYNDKIENLKHLNNKFVSSKNYEKHFKEILESSKKFPNWIISYNDSSWANIEKIQNILKMFKNEINVINIDYKYKYRKDQSSSAKEFLIICKK